MRIFFVDSFCVDIGLKGYTEGELRIIPVKSALLPVFFKNDLLDSMLIILY